MAGVWICWQISVLLAWRASDWASMRVVAHDRVPATMLTMTRAAPL
jgi:hypothetical protein